MPHARDTAAACRLRLTTAEGIRAHGKITCLPPDPTAPTWRAITFLMAERRDAPAAGGAHPEAMRRTLRTIAAFEAAKGVTALAASLGLLSLLHHDLHQMAVALIGHFGLDPGGHYPTIILHYADLVENADQRALVLLAAGYIALRFCEAYGLWRDRIWGQWLGALSGAIYVPLEVRHLIHGPTVTAAVVLVVNLLVVGFLAQRLRQERRRARV
jgi:uncharacterized membrane protein (DUF2068 family)